MTPMADEVTSAKRALRAELRERRRNATWTQRADAEEAIAERMIALVQDIGARSVAAYLSLPDEPSTRGFLAWAIEHELRVLVPIARVDGLLDWARYDGGEEGADLLGMPSPTTAVLGPIAVGDVDLIFVPAAAVDAGGMRMGWGRGYYDRTLGSMEEGPPVYAVLFDNEILDSVPRDPHDERVDGAVTPSRTLTFGGG